MTELLEVTGMEMKTNHTPWFKQKTTWAGISAIIGAAAGYFTGEMGLVPAVQTAVIAIMGIFLRQGVEKLK